MGENTPYIAIQAAIERYIPFQRSHHSGIDCSGMLTYFGLQRRRSFHRQRNYNLHRLTPRVRFPRFPLTTFGHLQFLPKKSLTSTSHSSLAISIGSTIPNNPLAHFTRLLTPFIPPFTVLGAGALDLSSLTTSPVVLRAL